LASQIYVDTPAKFRRFGEEKGHRVKKNKIYHQTTQFHIENGWSNVTM